jgi:hypothetical protein
MSSSSKSSSSSISSISSLTSRSSKSSSTYSSWTKSTSSQTESTSSSSSSISSLSSSSSSEDKATRLEFAFRGTKWSTSKLICSGICAIKNIYESNKQCQIIKIPFSIYTIKYISCFLRKLNKINTSYNLILEVYDTNENGLPETMLASKSISSDVVDNPAWYSFDFGNDLENKTTPGNQLLALVFYQDGGNEENYTNWYYSLDLDWDTKAYVSKDDGTTWVEQENMTRAVIISDIFDIFEEAYIDSNLHALTFPPGQEAKKYFTGSDYLGLGEFTNTQLADNAVAIEYKPSILSIVVDSSGSMGWNDRYGNRIDAIRSLIEKLKEKYPQKILFDLISFGSYRIGSISLESSATYVGTKLDLNNSDNYTLNNDGTIPSITDGLIAWGLKDLDSNHEYIISSINLLPSNSTIEDGMGTIITEINNYAPINYENIGNQNNSIKYSVENKGVGSEISASKAKNAIVCKVPLNNSSIIRKPFSSFRQLNTAFIVKDIKKGDKAIFVDGFDNFDVNSLIDIFDQNNIDTAFQIILKEQINGENKITLNRAVSFDFENSFTANGSLLQESSVSNIFFVDINDTMVELLVKDVQAEKAITFYFQTSKGGLLEWEFTPFQDWESLLLFYAGDAALLNFQAYDTEGNPLPDLTRIDLYVNELPKSIADSEKNNFVALQHPITKGDSSFDIYKDDEITVNIYNSVLIGDSIILKGIYNNATVLSKYKVTNIEDVTEYDPLNPTGVVTKKTITFYPIFYEDWNATEIMLSSKERLDASLKIDMPISAVDISPTKAGRKLPSELLEAQDPPQVDPSSNPNDFNQSAERKRDNLIDIPLIGGEGRIRVLPITEDVIETTTEKNKKAFSFYENTSLTDKEKISQEKQEKEYLTQTSKTQEQLQNEISPAQVETTIVSTEWTIETPIYLENGIASSHMTAISKNMVLQDFDNYNVDFIDNSSTRIVTDKSYSEGKILAEEYTIYPVITIKTNQKTVVQQMQSQSVFFQSAIQISSCIVGSLKTYCRRDIDKDSQVIFPSIDIPFIYSFSDDSIEMNFNIFYKGIFLKSGQMYVKIFDINRNATDMLMPSNVDINLQAEAAPYIPTFDAKTQSWISEPLSKQINYYHENTGDLYINAVGLKNNWQEATYLSGYTEGGYTIDIENGRATLNISSSTNINFASHLVVVAEIVSPNDNKRSTILTNTIFIANPLEIIPIINGNELVELSNKYVWIWPSNQCPGEDRIQLQGDGKTTYNFGAKIKWLGELVEDNIVVEFLSQEHNKSGGTGIKPEIGKTESSEEGGSLPGIWAATKITPGISKTIDGIAYDAHVGAHGSVIPHWVEIGSGEDAQLIEMGDIENITVKTSYNGIKCNFVIQAMWMGQEVYSSETSSSPLFVSSLLYKNDNVTDDNSLWADGWDYLLVLLDLSVSYLGNYPDIKETTPFLIGDVKIGNEYSKPVVVNFNTDSNSTDSFNFGKGTFTKNKPVNPVTNQPLNLLVTETTNIPYGWAISPPIRESFVPTIPENQPIESLCQECYPDACSMITIDSSNTVGTHSGVVGCWATNFENCQCIDPESGNPTKDWHKPKIIWKNPLQGNMLLMSESSPYIYDKIIMDGKVKTRIDVNVSFSGKAIPIIAKKYKVVKFWSAATANTISFSQQLSNMGGTGNISSVAWNSASNMAESNQEMIDYNNAVYNYYISIIQNQSSQTAGNLSLINNQAQSTVAWKDYFPTINFDIFLGYEVQDKTDPSKKTYEKTREVPALSLTQNEVSLSVQYTSSSIYENNEESSSISEEFDSSNTETIKHFHECNIDENGNGTTIKTFKDGTYNEIENHDHSISDFSIQNAVANGIVHYHELKSTVSVYINPFTLDSLGYVQSRTFLNEYGIETKQNELIILHVWTEYDASREFVDRALDLYKTFDPYIESDIPNEKIWDLNINVPDAFVQESTTNDYSGFSVDISLKRRDGLLPPDGTRVQIEMKPYAIGETKSDVSVSKSNINPYINIEFNAKTMIEGLKMMTPEEDGKSIIFTEFNWLPTVKKLVPEITDDELYIDKAITQIESIGSSQLNDAIVEASSRIKKYYLDNSDQSASYNIMVLSDGEENYSKNSFNYVIQTLSIGFNIPIYSVGLGNMDALGKNLLSAYAIKTSGSFVPLGANSADQIDEQIINIIKNQQTNYGIYSNVIELPESFYIKEVTPLVTLASGSNMFMSFQIGDYLNNLSSWSSEFAVTQNEPINIESFVNETKNKYIKYKVIMTGNDSFQSPLFLGCSSTYFQPRSCKVFSQPIETDAGINDVISEITVTHKATNSELVEIEYGICPFDSTKEFNYYNDYVLPFKSGERYIVLSRSNETMSSVDNITYQAINGPWDESLEIKVFSSSSSIYQMVNSDEYIVHPLEGNISFIIPRQPNENIIFSILFPSKFRILCKVKNHSVLNAYIDHIGLVYGIATNNPGKSVEDYINEFDSSSSSQ